MTGPKSWICDGVPKDGNSYNSAGPHPPHENSGPDCEMCGLPREAMSVGKTVAKTVVSGGGSKVSAGVVVAAVALLLIVGSVGWFLFRPKSPPEPESETGVVTNGGAVTAADPIALVSDTAVNGSLISQGEKILLSGGGNFQLKTEAATAFAAKDWNGAIQKYQQATGQDANDPEAKIYLNNARAKQAGNVMAIAVVVPITPSPNEAREVLRGVAQYQDEFNRNNPPQFMEVVVVDEKEALLADSLAQDLIGSSLNVLAVLGHGVDSNSRQALGNYEKNKIAALSPLNTAITKNDTGGSTVRTIPASQATTLLNSYLQKVGSTLANYAVKNNTAAVAVFYNSDSPYSEQMKNEFVSALSAGGGQAVQLVDIMAPDFDAATAINNVQQAGAKAAFLALSKNKVDAAVAIAKANNNQMALLAGDELYNPTLLVQGGEAVAGMVLAVPWRWRPDDPFARDAANMWQGRVSWRTATTYDATRALAIALTDHPGDRAAISAALNQGITVNNTATEFDLFQDIPLVKAVEGKSGPSGSRYQFDPM
ncbi:ABC transporter substrate-binding protein [[Phormidium] sp. ETS-05]|uniref:ABC transporter substrate-binding protein n=1 Tax=[Phormidium] sp. ETS-05 TaxID=222819 RepID=UPI0018EF1011|nr:ABC transporter substrate-binding protein [[Phormidium] sp. ETS-05]